MNFLRHQAEIDRVVPGVSAVYKQLRSSNGQGLYTSLGRYYNNTIFGRDAGMSAKFVTHFDHDVAWQTILTLAYYQGQDTNKKTMEAPGKIHHEMRDFSKWQGRWYDRLGLEVAGYVWGKQNRKLVSYYAADSTATYIRLINKYSQLIDKSIIDRQVPRHDSTTTLLGDSVASAANWLSAQVDETGIFWTRRTNRWSLPYQIFADSVTAYSWQNGRAANAAHKHSFIEAHAYALDALSDAANLLPMHSDSRNWQKTADKMRQALLNEFWNNQQQIFHPAIFSRGTTLMKLDSEMITSVWILNASFWDDLSTDLRHSMVEAIVRRIFKDDFLTEYGIRTKSLKTSEPLGEMIDYHGSQTIWPMFNFMVIEGLRRHGLYRLARQVEFRLINTINALDDFPEFFIVDKNSKLYTPNSKAKTVKHGQMIPEQNIAFTVVPALTLAYRNLYPRTKPVATGWQLSFEEEILSTIARHKLLAPDTARQEILVTPLKIKRTLAGLKSAAHIAAVILKPND